MFRSQTDAGLLWMLRATALAAGMIVVLIALFVALESVPALSDLGLRRFFSDRSWHPAGGATAGQYNLTPMLVGTVAASIGAVLVATPLGVASALFGRFFAPSPVATAYRRLMGVLSGIPSVVYGFWGLVTLAPLIRAWHPPGQSLLAAVLILAIMILPTIALLSESALRAVPESYLRGATALGLSRWAKIRGVALPAARSGIFTAVLLATGRAVGETMAVLMVAGNVVQVPQGLFDSIRTITANIALELGYAAEFHRSSLFVSGLALLCLIVAIVGFANWIGRRSGYHE